jgi:hypothetical protein
MKLHLLSTAATCLIFSPSSQRGAHAQQASGGGCNFCSTTGVTSPDTIVPEDFAGPGEPLSCQDFAATANSDLFVESSDDPICEFILGVQSLCCPEAMDNIDMCTFCPNGITAGNDFQLPADTTATTTGESMTCGEMALAASIFPADDFLCEAAKITEMICCPTDTDQQQEATTTVVDEVVITTTSAATTTPAAVTTTTAAATTVVAAPPLTYTPEQCDAWTATALAADTTNSGGLTEAEYLTFLQSITDPSYVGEYFTTNVDAFTSLPYTARILYKIISCGCTALPGYNATSCCTGTNIEMPLDGFDGNNSSPEARAHRTYFCETLATLIKKVPTPNPTSAPTVAPTTLEPTRSPTMEPTTLAPVTLRPTISPTSSPTINVTIPIPAVKAPEPEDNGGGGLSKGAIAGIIIAILLAILAALLLIAYLRHREQQRLREFASGNDDEDLGVEEEEEEESSVSSSDSSSEPSVWSESNERGEDMVDDVEEQKVTEATGVAAMGAASNLVTQMELSMSERVGSGSE